MNKVYVGFDKNSENISSLLKQVKDSKWANIHIPKTGGTYCTNVILKTLKNKNLDLVYYSLSHSSFQYQEFPRINDKMWYQSNEFNDKPDCNLISSGDIRVFSTVRNPFSLLCSWYRSNFANVKEELRVNNFSDFIKSFSYRWGYEGEIPGCSAEWKKIYLNSATAEGKKIPKITFAQTRLKPWSNFLFFQIFANSGGPTASLVFRQEMLDEALSLFLSAYNVKPLKIKTKEKNITSTSNFDYRRMYTDETRELIENKCQRELKYFGYNFDGPTDNFPLLMMVGDPSGIYSSNPDNYFGYFG